MNLLRSRPIQFALIALVVLAVGFYLYNRWYSTPIAKERERMAQINAQIRAFGDATDAQYAARKTLKEIASTTLGKNDDVVKHRFRSLLSAVGEEAGLSNVVVEHGQARAVENPASGERIETNIRRSLRERADFLVLRGQLVGIGPLEATIRAIAGAKAQPWVHRVEGFSIKPADKERTRYEVRVDVATILLPDLASDKQEPVLASLADLGTSGSGIVDKSVFKRPPPPAAEPDPKPTQTASKPRAKPKPPYDDWRLTAIITGGPSLEAFMVNTKTNERRVLSEGGEVLGAKLVEAAGERAIFELDGTLYEVLNGQTLAARRPLTQ